MLTLISILLLLASAYFFISPKLVKGALDPVKAKSYKTKGYKFAVGAVLVYAINGLFFYANAGTAYAIQYPWGGDKMVTSQGVKVKGWGKVIPITFEISVKDIIPTSSKNEDGQWIESAIPEDEPGMYYRRASKWEFNDAIKADIATSIILSINTTDLDEDGNPKFLTMADKNRSEHRLLEGRVLPNIDAVLKNTCKLMDAQDYISGAASNFDRYFKDQLKHGMYRVEQYYEQDETGQKIGDSSVVRTVGSKSSKQKKFRIMLDAQGNPVREKSNSLEAYGIKIHQANVTGIDWESSFDKRLDLQKNEVAQTQLEKQQAEREFYRAQKEKAKGESNKVKERARLEKEQIQQTIAAETRAKVAAFRVTEENQLYKAGIIAAKTKKVAADAQYYENAKLVSAGLTPQERAELELKKADVVSGNFAKMASPSTVIIGGKGGSGDTTNALIQANMAKQFMKD